MNDAQWFQDFKRRTLAEADVRLSMGGAMFAFDESKVKRGQPENAGQFGSGGGKKAAPEKNGGAAASPDKSNGAASAPQPNSDAQQPDAGQDQSSPSPDKKARAAGVLSRYGARMSDAVDKVPVVGFIKTKMTAAMKAIHDTAAKRYGPKTAKLIMASGTVMDMALMAGGAAMTGVPIVTGFNQLVGIIPAFVLAEGKHLLTGGAKFDIGGKWITIGGHAEGDEKHVGGFPAKISDDGNIQKGGPPQLKGKKVGQVKETFDEIEEVEEAEEVEEVEEAKQPVADLNKKPGQENLASTKSESSATDSFVSMSSRDVLAMLGVDGGRVLSKSPVKHWSDHFKFEEPKEAVGVHVSVAHPKLGQCSRFLGVDEDGAKFIKTDALEVKPEFQGQGLGTDIFSKMAKAAAAGGFGYIQTHASGDPSGNDGQNGYYTWPRLGYNATIDDIEDGDEELGQNIRSQFPDAVDILDVMATEGGPEWWKKNGGELLDARFDLKEGSKSWDVLNAYLEHRKTRG